MAGVSLVAALCLAGALAAFWVHVAHAQSGDEAKAPSNLTAAIGDGGVILNWSSPVQDAASVTGYEILRRRPREGEGTLLVLVADTGSTATTYVDATANEPGVRYVYRVKALENNASDRPGGLYGPAERMAAGAAVLGHEAFLTASGQQTDGVKPALSVTDPPLVNGLTLTLTYDEPLDATSEPAPSDFEILVNSGVRPVAAVVVSGSAVTLTLESSVTIAQTVTVSYTPGNNAIRDEALNDADALTNQSVTNETRTNILLITADDLHWDSVGAFGSPVRGATPNIDQLATDGIRFDHAHVTISVCTPNRSVLMTGRYPHLSGGEGFHRLKLDGVPILPALLRSEGYTVGILDKVDHSTPYEDFIWDTAQGKHRLGFGRNPEAFYQHAKTFVEGASDSSLPFFLMANSRDPHRPFYGNDHDSYYEADIPALAPSHTFTSDDVVVPGFLPDLTDVRTEVAEYYSSVRRLDDTVGRLLDVLDDTGVAENTIVMFLSDNGVSFPFAKANVYFNSTRTPWIVRWPGVIQSGSVDAEHFISSIDLMPTILDAIGADIPAGVNGKTFLPLLHGEDQDGRGQVFTQFHETSGRRAFPMRSVQNAQFGYIYNHWSDGIKKYGSESQHGRTWAAMKAEEAGDEDLAARTRLYSYRVPEELYDYESDPDALENLIDDPDYAAELDALRTVLKEWMVETSDPLLSDFRVFTAGVTLGEMELTVPEGGSETYTVKLASEPTADVTVTITGHAGTDLTLTPTPAMLTFTPSTWDRTQTVTVAAGDDGDALNDSALLTHWAMGATEYALVTASLSVTVTDDDTMATGAPAIIGKVEVEEELTANTSGIDDADGLTSPGYAYRWVRVASGGGESDIPAATGAGHTVTGGDVGDAFKLRVTFTDDKGNPESLTSAPTAVATVAQVQVFFAVAAYVAAEGGPAAEVQIVLDNDPHRRVRIGLTATPSGGADTGDYTTPTQVVFNAGEMSQDVTITAVDDSVDDDGESVELTFGMLPDGVSEGTTNRSVVQITDNDENQPPVVTGDRSLTFAENTATTTVLHNYDARDPEGSTTMFTWSLGGTDSGDFEISDRGELTFKNVPDFEMAADADGDNGYLATVEARDEDFKTGTLDVTVTVTNGPGPEEPTITTTGNPSPYRENGTGTVYTFRARDPQGQPLAWSVEGADADDFNITTDGGVLTFASPPDFENPTDADRNNVYEIRVVVTDEQGLVDRADVTVTVANDPEGVEPTISTRSPPATYGENGSATVYTFRATDPQGGSITWSLGGVDAGAFDLGETGALTFVSSPDFENPSDVGGDNEYDLTVSATDEDGHADRLSFAITVEDVNEGPEVARIGSAPGSVAESDDPSQVLARYTATDPEDLTATITLWSASGTDGGDFVMNAQGELRFRNQPDHEGPADSDRDNVYEFMVRASDGRNYGTFEETVTVSNVEEPGMVTFSASAPVVNSRLIARLADPDGNVQSPTWEWESSPDGSSGWAFISGETSDAYTPATEDLETYLRATVRYDDGEGLGKRAEGITTNPVRATSPPRPITGGGGGGGGPVNQPPVFSDADGNVVTETGRVIAEDAAPGTEVGEPVIATDPEEDVLTYSLSGDDAASFAIDASTGQLTTATSLDHETKASYSVIVTATDPSGAAAEVQVAITVTAVSFDCSSGNAVADAVDNPGLVADCEALLSSRNRLSGDATLNWSEDTPIAEWDGVILGETPRRVSQLYLVRKGLDGTIPADLGSLSGLTGLYLHRNELTGPIPAQLGELSSLVHLTLHRNQLSGEIPPELGDLNSLTYLSLYGNELTGEIPAELGGLSSLRWLYLHSNQTADGGGLSGPIPASFGDLQNLERLMLYGNRLSGAIPTELGELSALKSLLLHDNELTGRIPDELGNLSSLRYLWLDDNDLSGAIPPQLGDLSSLRWLSLYGNDLSGPIPSELGNLTGLRLLVLDRNDLSGAIPARLGELSELTWLDLNDNDLSGPIPAELGDLSNLEHLYLHDNELTGVVPADLGQLSNLTNLWLRDNRLSGQIPPSLGELPNLQRVRIAGNAFTGCVPDGLLGGTRWYSDAEELELPACGP